MKNTINRSPLSKEMKVLTEIYHNNANSYPICYKKLVLLLNKEMDSEAVSKALNELFDWGLVESSYGEYEPGRSAKLLSVDSGSIPTIRDLYKKYWQPYRNQ